jgi:hypothetical protein
MSFRNKTIEELEDVECDLNNQVDYPNYNKKIEVYKEMFRRYNRLARQKNDEYKD